MATNPKEITDRQFVAIKINGKSYFGNPTETILQISQRNGIEIPHLCYKEGMRPDGNCRACMVEIEGERVLQPSCVRTISDGMVINTNSERVTTSQKLVLELLSSDVSDKTYKKVRVGAIDLDKVKKLLSEASGCKLVDQHVDGGYITPLEAQDDFKTYISRVRKDKSNEKAINMWIVSDNLLKGAALNSVQIAETLVKYKNK